MSVSFKSYRPKVVTALNFAKARALEVAGGTAERYTKENLTKNHSVRTGNLRNSITHQQIDENSVLIGSNVQYAPYVELGTSKMRAKPYLRPAIEDHRSEYQKIFESELGKIT